MSRSKARAAKSVLPISIGALGGPGMPKMPDLKVASLPDPVTRGAEADAVSDEEDKKEEKRMAEIIVRLQMAKQHAEESKKRKLDEEKRASLFGKLQKENINAISTTKRRRIAEVKKLRTRQSDIVDKISSELKKYRDDVAAQEMQQIQLSDRLLEISSRLKRLLESIGKKNDELRMATQSDSVAARAEIDRKLNELESAAQQILNSSGKDDKFSSLINVIVKSFT